MFCYPIFIFIFVFVDKKYRNALEKYEKFINRWGKWKQTIRVKILFDILFYIFSSDTKQQKVWKTVKVI